MNTLEQTRELDGATLQDEEGRYYLKRQEGGRAYGYSTHFTGAYVCYTCGVLCDCEGEGE